MFKRWRSLLRVLTRRRAFEARMTEELRFHLDQQIDELVRSGMSPEKAARQARMELGGFDSVKEACREQRGLHVFDEFRRELSYAFRLLRKTPGFTATALLTLAVCSPFCSLRTFPITTDGGGVKSVTRIATDQHVEDLPSRYPLARPPALHCRGVARIGCPPRHS